VLEYSQSGDVTKVADAFTRPLHRPGVEVHRESLQPLTPYPYPWGSMGRLFSIFPECFVGPPDPLQPLTLQPDDRFDLVVLAYQVWHLAPSIPIQAFFQTAQVRVLKNTPAITLCICRSMWHSASETMKQLLRDAGAIHLDNVVITHPGPAFSTFVSVPRALLWGRRDRLWGIFPPADLSPSDLERAERLGNVVAAHLDDVHPGSPSLLAGQGAVEVKRRSIVPELMGRFLYRHSARVVARITSRGSFQRQIAIYACLTWMMLVILFGIPLCIVVVFLLSPFSSGRLDRYARQLAAPSG
jgi:hypothetical protein